MGSFTDARNWLIAFRDSFANNPLSVPDSQAAKDALNTTVDDAKGGIKRKIFLGLRTEATIQVTLRITYPDNGTNVTVDRVLDIPLDPNLTFADFGDINDPVSLFIVNI